MRTGLAQVRKKEETEKIVLADDLRDKALEAFGKALKLYAVSDDQAEVEARPGYCAFCTTTFPICPRLNYEAETIGIDKLVDELNGPNYAAKVGFLHLERYVARISNANEAFKKQFGGRMTNTALTETYDLKSIRLEMFRRYSDFCNYVLAMAKALDTPLFVTTLDLLNTARKYYADLLARRTAASQTDTAKPAK